MKRFESGVRRYTRLAVTIRVDFPEGDEVCERCRLCVRDPYNSQRKVCFVTGELLFAPEWERPEGCPLEREERVADGKYAVV